MCVAQVKFQKTKRIRGKELFITCGVSIIKGSEVGNKKNKDEERV